MKHFLTAGRWDWVDQFVNTLPWSSDRPTLRGVCMCAQEGEKKKGHRCVCFCDPWYYWRQCLTARLVCKERSSLWIDLLLKGHLWHTHTHSLNLRHCSSEESVKLTGNSREKEEYFFPPGSSYTAELVCRDKKRYQLFIRRAFGCAQCSTGFSWKYVPQIWYIKRLCAVAQPHSGVRYLLHTCHKAILVLMWWKLKTVL